MTFTPLDVAGSGSGERFMSSLTKVLFVNWIHQLHDQVKKRFYLIRKSWGKKIIKQIPEIRAFLNLNEI